MLLQHYFFAKCSPRLVLCDTNASCAPECVSNGSLGLQRSESEW